MTETKDMNFTRAAYNLQSASNDLNACYWIMGSGGTKASSNLNFECAIGSLKAATEILGFKLVEIETENGIGPKEFIPKSNGKLIAAAPELLSSLTIVLERYKKTYDESVKFTAGHIPFEKRHDVIKARSDIARAKGE